MLFRSTPGTGSGPCKQVIVGIMDFEYFGRSSAQKKASCQIRGHCHFFAKGDITVLCCVVDIFKKVVLGTLWRDDWSPTGRVGGGRSSSRGP